MKFLSKKLTGEFGKGGIQLQILKICDNFIRLFQLATHCVGSHYRLLVRVEDKAARDFYIDECAKSNWSTRQLERQINSFYYQRLLSSQNKRTLHLKSGITTLILFFITIFKSVLSLLI
ncbi:MAG: DUF1016 N-terminal domain-containing protein [Oscillospiraceae bacterium]